MIKKAKEYVVIYAFLLILLPTACQQNRELTIPKEELILIMADMHLAEAAMQRMNSKMKDTLSARYYSEIYEVHQIDEAQYLSNLKVLENDPDLAKDIFEAVLGKIGEEENREEEKREK